MKPFQSVQHILTVFCICSSVDVITTRHTKFVFISFTLIIHVILLLSFLSSSIYLFKFMIIDPENSLYALWQIVAYISSIYTLFSAYLMRKKFIDIFNRLEHIFDSCKQIFKCNISFIRLNHSFVFLLFFWFIDKETKFFNLLANVNANNEWIALILIKFCVIGYIIACFVLAAINVIYCVLKFGYLNVDYLFIPYKLV